ncbi:MAG: TetR/AcrR family transcriptional regulator, partial [Candidatus Omnitrophica bacterium]|nr:TetR/AcrR family transcriptional regulator [Candidatus Omnitrophota bacterium]
MNQEKCSRTERKEKRQQQILQAASQIFSDKGYWKADMESISRRAGLAKGTIYLYFPGKEELFLSLFKSGQTELLNKILSLIRQGLSFTRMVEEAVDIYLNFFQQYPA